MCLVQIEYKELFSYILRLNKRKNRVSGFGDKEQKTRSSLLRRFGTGTDAGTDELAFFSEGEIVTGCTCDMMEVDNRPCS
jgi:hypothetical protein